MNQATELVPRAPIRGVVAVWAVAAVIGILIAVFLPRAVADVWFPLTAGLMLPLTFGVQLAFGRSIGFIQRVSASVAGAVLVLGVISVVDALIFLLTP